MSSELVNYLTEFINCSIHSILYVRGIYPAVLFEQRMYLGVSVWQSRHPEINTYIRRVIDNMRPLLKVVRMILLSYLCHYVTIFPLGVFFLPQDAVERVVFATISSTGVPIDHVSIKCRPVGKPDQPQSFDEEDVQWQDLPSSDIEFGTLQEELRSAILKVGLLDTQLPKLPEGKMCIVEHTLCEDCVFEMMPCLFVSRLHVERDGDHKQRLHYTERRYSLFLMRLTRLC